MNTRLLLLYLCLLILGCVSSTPINTKPSISLKDEDLLVVKKELELCQQWDSEVKKLRSSYVKRDIQTAIARNTGDWGKSMAESITNRIERVIEAIQLIHENQCNFFEEAKYNYLRTMFYWKNQCLRKTLAAQESVVEVMQNPNKHHVRHVDNALEYIVLQARQCHEPGFNKSVNLERLEKMMDKEHKEKKIWQTIAKANIYYHIKDNRFGQVVDTLEKQVEQVEDIELKLEILLLNALERERVGFYDAALRYAKQALQLAKQEKFDRSPIYLIEATYRVGSVYKNIGDLDKAYEFYNQCMAYANEFKSFFSYAQPLSYIGMGDLMLLQSNRNGALNMYQRYLFVPNFFDIEDSHTTSFVLMYEILGAHYAQATSYEKRGMVYEAEGKYRDALGFYNKAASIRESRLGPMHPDTADLYIDIGVVYNHLNEFDKALEFLLRGVDIYEQALEPVHPNKVVAYHALGTTYLHKRDADKALSFLHKALAMDEKTRDSHHARQDTALTLYNLGMAYKLKKDNEKALSYLRQALTTKEKAVGGQHKSLLPIRDAIADLCKSRYKPACKEL